MPKQKRCWHCRKRFVAKCNPKQHYCGAAKCQQIRKNRWEKNKRQSDPDYRENQRRAQQAWSNRNRGYWPVYRQKNRGAEAKNAKGEAVQRTPMGAGEAHVKMDAQISKTSELSRDYIAFLVKKGDVAKMDASELKNSLLSMSCPVFLGERL